MRSVAFESSESLDRVRTYRDPVAWDEGRSGGGAGYLLYHGDCLRILDQFPAEVFDCIIADPPYFLSGGGLTVSNGKAAVCHKGGWDQSGGVLQDWSFHLSWLAACRRVLNPAGTIWIFGTYHAAYQCGLALQQLGFKILNEVIWYKPNAAPNLSCRVLTASHETIIWARREYHTHHTFNYHELKDGVWSRDFLKRPNRQMRSVWAVAPPGAGEKRHGRHPTQKPVELLRRVVLASTNPGDLVLDPFAGSGTTGVGALSLGRSFVGIERERRYLELCRERLGEVCGES